MPLPWTNMNLADDETFPVKVFKDHPDWDKHAKWWMMPMHLIRELYVATYDVSEPEHLKWLEDNYPGHVFVYSH